MAPKTTSVPRLWQNETAVCVAAGPSLTQADVDYCRGKAKVIVINRSYELAKWAEAMYACDSRLWKWVNGAPDFPGLKFTLDPMAKRWPGVRLLGKGPHQGLSLDPAKLCLGGNSGYQALNLAVLLGATRILLLGYDMGVSSKGKQHWHGDHPNKMRSPYQTFLNNYPTLVEPLTKAGIEVINCSRETRLKCFPRMTIEEALPVLSVEHVA